MLSKSDMKDVQFEKYNDIKPQGDSINSEELGKESIESNEKETIGWFAQFYCLFKKNCLELSRRPVAMIFLILSSVFSFLIIYGLNFAFKGNDIHPWYPNAPFNRKTLPEMNSCGVPSVNWMESFQNRNYDYDLDYDISLDMNDKLFGNGIAQVFLALGPTINAIICFTVIHEEFQTKMVGVLRSLAVRESLFWFAWFLPFAIIALLNSLLGAGVAKIVPVHAFKHTFYIGIFASLFFLHLAVTAASLFLVAIVGSIRKVAVWICIIIFLAMIVDTVWPGISYIGGDLYSSPMVNGGAYFRFQETRPSKTYTSTFSYYTVEPIMSYKYQDPDLIKQQTDQIPNSDYFTGCYVSASLYDGVLSGPGQNGFFKFILFMIPYTHFNVAWSNFLGVTALPGLSFTSSLSNLPSYRLANEAILKFNALQNRPTSIAVSEQGGTLFPQNSMINFQNPQNPDIYYYDVEIGNCATMNISNIALTNGSTYIGKSPQLCSYLNGPGPIVSGYSFNDTLGCLFLLCIINLILAWYWAQVFPLANGSPRPFHFPFLKSYWFPSSSSSKGLNSSNKNLIQLQNISKQFGDFHAVKNINLDLSYGELVALLGHNGAGKSTTIKMLTCDIKPSQGDITVFGEKEISKIRQFIGLCQQDDYLFKLLSAREHLELFGTLRGLKSSELSSTIDEWLNDVDLQHVQNYRANTYSGGMKRRLSVILATIGNNKLIVLDEPTTGMDPLNRRFVWRHLEKIKKNSVVLMSTHALEEADLLSDKIAVMHSGEIAAYGTSLDLKKEYGTSILFSLLVDPECVEEATKDISYIFKDAPIGTVEISTGDAGNLSVRIKNLQEEEGIAVEKNEFEIKFLLNFVDWLEDGQEYLTEWGYSNSSLEEVYLNITGKLDEQIGKMTQKQKICCTCCCTGCIRCCLSGCCACCCCPKTVQMSSDANDDVNDDTNDDNVLTAKVLQDDDDETLDVDTIKEELSKLPGFIPKLNVMHQFKTLLIRHFSTQWLQCGCGSISNWIVYSIFLILVVVICFLSNFDFNPDSLGILFAIFFSSLILPSMVSQAYEDRHLGMLSLMFSHGMLRIPYLMSQLAYYFIVQFVYGFLVISIVYPFYFNYEFNKNDFSNSGLQSSFEYQMDENYTLSFGFIPGFGAYGLLIAIVLTFSIVHLPVAMILSYLPGYKLGISLVSLYALVAGIVPAYIYFLQYKGINNAPDCEFSYTQDYLNCKAFQKFYLLGALPSSASMLAQFGMFLQGYYFLISNIQIKVGYYDEYSNQQIVDEEKTLLSIKKFEENGISCDQNTYSCEFSLTTSKMNESFGYSILGGTLWTILCTLIFIYFIYPPPFIQRFKFQLKHFTKKCFKCCEKKKKTVAGKKQELSMEISDNSDVENEKIIVKNICNKVLLNKDRGNNDDLESQEQENVDMIKILTDSQRSQLPSAITHGLQKIYPALGNAPEKVAVDDLYLNVPKGTVLGLLGQNGAGKTSAFGCISGKHEPTSGFAFTAGYDITENRFEVFKKLGNCPQFDVIWPSISVQKHLEFFATLKGMPAKQAARYAEQMATAVGLGNIGFKRQAGKLSGGMRRRLSMAIAFTGAPELLLLDEPSTGLDPSTRNNIWNLIHSFCSPSRAIIITTHMMLEADTLCNKIAIMKDSRLKAVGTQQHLKNKFGNGFILELNLEDVSREKKDLAIQFIKEHVHPNPKINMHQGKLLKINLPKEGLSLKKVFKALYLSKTSENSGITEFMLSQSSLEDVFLSVG